MSYGLGVDLGTTFTAAAVARDGRIEMATLGDHTDAVPSVVLIRDDGTVLTGGVAERRATAEPDRVARAVKRRFGDPMPVILGGAPHPATALIAHQLRDVVDVVSDREGGRPGMVTLTHPANWGPYKCELFAQVPELAGVGEVHMLTEPEAAAAHYARNDRLDPGALVAVYDLGGGTFDATVLRTTEHGFDILGRPEGIEGLGGIDFDEAVFTHVDQTLDGAVSRLDPADPRATSAAIRLRHECVTAKETLSADTETTIPVLLPELQTEVRLTRGEFEKMIRPAIGATIASLRRALQSARIDPSQLHTVLLVGGSSRIPMVAHLVSAELGRPTSVDTHPKHAIALGAAAVGADTTGVGAAATAAPAPDRLTPPARRQSHARRRIRARSASGRRCRRPRVGGPSRRPARQAALVARTQREQPRGRWRRRPRTGPAPTIRRPVVLTSAPAPAPSGDWRARARCRLRRRRNHRLPRAVQLNPDDQSPTPAPRIPRVRHHRPRARQHRRHARQPPSSHPAPPRRSSTSPAAPAPPRRIEHLPRYIQHLPRHIQLSHYSCRAHYSLVAPISTPVAPTTPVAPMATLLSHPSPLSLSHPPPLGRDMRHPSVTSTTPATTPSSQAATP